MAIYKTVVNIRLPLLLCLMAFCLNISYAGENNKRLITLKFADEPLPSALKRLEKAGRKSILFTYKETERFRVTATVANKTQAEALRILLSGKPFAFVERNAYFVVQYSESRQRSVSVRGRVTDQNGKPMAYAMLLCWLPVTSRISLDASRKPTELLPCLQCRRKTVCSACLL